MQMLRIVAVLVWVVASPIFTPVTTDSVWASGQQVPRLIDVKYRPTPVDVADPRFEYLDTSGSSLVNDAWYDESNSYMVIGLYEVYYHYCQMPGEAWESFRSAASFGRHYIQSIRGRYDCRLGGVPEY